MKIRYFLMVCLIGISNLPAKITPLHRAISENDFKLVCDLIGNKVDVNAPDGVGNTPLHTAACFGHAMMARVLLDNGAQVDASNKYGETPLHLAALWGHLQTVVFLLGRKACINKQNGHGYTALHYATLYGHYDVVWKLLDAYADDALCDKDGNNSFMLAVKYGKLRMVELFIDFNCGKEDNLLEVRNKDGLNALDIAYNERISPENVGDQRRETIVTLLEFYARQVISKCPPKTPLAEHRV
jgi:ankyrin repeat protein